MKTNKDKTYYIYIAGKIKIDNFKALKTLLLSCSVGYYFNILSQDRSFVNLRLSYYIECDIINNDINTDITAIYELFDIVNSFKFSKLKNKKNKGLNNE